MSHIFRVFDRVRARTSLLAVAAIAVAAFSLGLLTATRTRAWTSQQISPAGNHEVSQKLWVSAQEIKDRFSASQHEEFMKKAIANSRTAGVEKRTGGAFGAVIVNRNGQIIAEGTNQVVANFDPTWHGEMHAIRNACAALKTIKLDGCIIYTSSEPCPMCLATCYWAGLDGVVFGAEVADSKKYGGFDDSFIYEQFTKPASARSITQTQMLHDDAVNVWKEYASLSDNVPY
jgi:guanine deaminase